MLPEYINRMTSQLQDCKYTIFDYLDNVEITDPAKAKLYRDAYTEFLTSDPDTIQMTLTLFIKTGEILYVKQGDVSSTS